MHAIDEKREREKKMVSQMIALYCRGKHGSRRGALCPECAALRDYARERSDHCPRMEVKTFCSNCPSTATARRCGSASVR